MKNRLLKSVVSLALVLVMVTSVFSVSFTCTYAAQVEEIPVISAGSGDFDEGKNFMPKQYYQQLGMNLGDARSMDKKPEYNPLLGTETKKSEGDTTLTYTGEVVYGWSNPQLVAVLMSAPYWNELYYGDYMEAAGEATFKLSTGYGTSSETTTTTNVGISISADGEVSYAGNGVVFGADLELSADTISSTVAEKSSTVGLTLSCGADTDNVVVSVVPLAFYKYELVNGKETTFEYVQVPVGMVYSVTSLTNYNNVARSINKQTGEEQMLEVSTKELYHSYTPGDPGSYFQNASEMPTSFKILDGRLVATSSDAEITGSVYSSDGYVNIGTGQSNAGGTLNYSCEKSNGYVNGTGYTMGAGAYGGVTFGVDALGVTSKGTMKLGITSETNVMTSVSEMNTQGIETSVTYVNLPNGTDPDYGYVASQLVWYPTQVSESAVGCPTCIITSTVIPSGFPPFLPDDLHVSSVQKDSVTLSWTNAKAGTTAYDRRPDNYDVIQVISSGNTTSHVPVTSIDGTRESVTIDSLEPNTSYKFALQSKKGDSKSVVGPVVEITTSFDGMPIITKQPQDMFVYLGETAQFSVEAVPANEGGELSYQWQKLSRERYGSTFVDIPKEESDTLTIDTYNIDSDIYRCIVMETNGTKTVNTVSDCATIRHGYVVTSYEDLCFIAEKVNASDPDYVNAYYMQTCDIKIPSGSTWEAPIGKDYKHTFKGVYDGQGYSISGLNSTVGGLFGEIEEATLKNINLKDINVSVYEMECGGLCETVDYDSLVTNCTVSGKISVNAHVGNNPLSCGGICANAYSGATIEKCINYCTVDAGTWYLAGICGYNSGTVKDCANFGTIDGDYIYYDYMNKEPAQAAGIVVANYGTVENCYNAGQMIGPAYSKSITHMHNGSKNCYYLDTVASDSNAKPMTVEQFESGEVAYLLNNGVTDGTQVWYQNVDYKEPFDEYPHFDKNDNNTVYNDDGVYTNIVPKILEKDEDGNYIIRTYDDLLFMAEKINASKGDYATASYVVANDIECDPQIKWVAPIGQPKATFKGTFDGQGYTISGLTSEYADEYTGSYMHYGLFGSVEDATIKNVNLADVDIMMDVWYVAGLCGYMDGGTITNCTVSGKISSNREFTKLAGIVSHGAYADISKCINYCDITGINSYINGIAGVTTRSSVNNCANFGDLHVDTTDDNYAYVYSIASSGYYKVYNSYNVGKLTGGEGASTEAFDSLAVNCYYLEGTTNGGGGTSKTLSQFNSGEVTYLLNQNIAIPQWAWFQNVDNGKTPDEYPTLHFTKDNAVLKVDREDKTYSNIPNDYLIGDADLDGKVTVMDATIIQMHCAQLYELSGVALVNADTTRDVTISISDATKIQGYIAGIIDTL